ncbi:MAG: VWA domain-containing protein [Clostridiales bacterium]|jgi:Ca-activated chloride channel family protein|nr:VWA domain-containing protein [Clostridiales bacterium]
MPPRSNKGLLIIIGLAVLVFGVTFLVVNGTRNVGMTASQVTEEQALSTMERLYKRIRVNTLPPRKDQVELNPVNVADTLPEISKYPAQVENTTQDFIEIFSSTEKATVSSNRSTDTDRWLVDMGEAFNRSGANVNGTPVSVRVRGMASGLAMDYISSGKYVPDAFTPSNELWGDALEANGVEISLAEKRLTGNAAGIVLSKTKQKDIMDKYGSTGLNAIVQAVTAGDLIMGYTNPLSSSTGANFLTSTLYSFDQTDPFSDEAVAAFEGFQENIPFVAYTTLQMKDSAQSGALEGFVFEAQQFANSPDLRADYEFTPFGVRHDSPVYALGDLSPVKREILDQFIAYCKTAESQQAAEKFGFNQYDDYVLELTGVHGGSLSQAQKLWKEKKSGSREIIAVFVADISGSMDGARLNQLKQSLLIGANMISPESSVGLVTFSDDVNIALPIGKFDLNQRALFTGAVRDMSAVGGTAMFDAIVVAEKILSDARAVNPNAKYMLFVLTDGEANKGASLKDTREMIEGLKIPIYTIGYEADISALQAVSSINEAASINADAEDVVYKIQNLFNAEI